MEESDVPGCGRGGVVQAGASPEEDEAPDRRKRFAKRLSCLKSICCNLPKGAAALARI